MPDKIPNLNRFLIVISCLLFLNACNLTSLDNSSANEPNVIYVTVTPSNGDSQGQQVAVQVQPSLTPIPADVALAQAERFSLNGYFENAVFMYQSVLAQGEAVAADQRATAAYGMGQAAVREGLYTEAVSSLTLLITQFPQDERVAQAYFLRGDAYSGLSMWNEAIADYQQYLALRPGWIDSYVHERIGDAQLALGQSDAALQSYTTATQFNRHESAQAALHERVARLYESIGQTTQAVGQYDAILAFAQNHAYRAVIELRAGQAYLAGGDTENGLARMQRVFNDYSDTTSAYHAMTTLIDYGVELDDYAVGQVAFNFGDYQTAINAFNSYTSTHVLAAIPARLHLLLGRAYREIGNSAAARVAFQTIIDQYPQDPLFGEALLEQGRTYFLAGDNPSAITHYLFIADNYGYLPEAAEALWRAGYLYSVDGNLDVSREIFTRLADAYPNTEQARSGLFIAASGAYNQGLTAVAENLFGRLSITTTGEDQSAAYLWVGRLALQRGDSVAANQAFDLAIQAAPDSYFAARAGDIRSGVTPFQRPANYQFQFDDATQIAEAETWLRQTFGITQDGPLWPLSPTLETDTRLIRGRELWAVAAYDEAIAEFDSVLEELRNTGNVLGSYQMAIFLRGIGAYLPSIVAAADVIRAGGVSTLDAPPYIARMRFPAYYLDVVLEATQQYNIDPLLMFSLIRHESLFNTYATAAAGEKGLTQVIPSTGDYIAGQLNWPDYQHSDLFRPYAGIAFGAYYLGEQLQLFDFNVPASLGAYNAGPGRASQWLAIAGDDPDLFMATITIDSTRLYVERIYSYHNVYRALYGRG